MDIRFRRAAKLMNPPIAKVPSMSRHCEKHDWNSACSLPLQLNIDVFGFSEKMQGFHAAFTTDSGGFHPAEWGA